MLVTVRFLVCFRLTRTYARRAEQSAELVPEHFHKHAPGDDNNGQHLWRRHRLMQDVHPEKGRDDVFQKPSVSIEPQA